VFSLCTLHLSPCACTWLLTIYPRTLHIILGQPSYHLGSTTTLRSILLQRCPTPGLIWLLQLHRSSTAQLQSCITYSSHGRADIPPLSTTLGLIPIQSLLHLTVYPALTWVLHVLDISPTLYHFHQTWPSPNSGCSLSAFKAVYLSP